MSADMLLAAGAVSVLIGDARERLRELPDASVHCCVTSPPYFGLRDYGVDGQMGLEPTPDEYVAGMVALFREVKRVLRDDGTLWLNLGDSYASYRDGKATPDTTRGDNIGTLVPKGSAKNRMASTFTGTGIKHKDLIGIPWRVAFALQQPWTDWQIKDEAMRAWVAGIVDGEGCVTILQTKSSHSDSLSFPPIVQVRMCDREPLDRLVDVVGSSIGEPQHPPSQVATKQRPSWQWKVTADRAAKVIAEIYPFLTCKRKQAIVAWNHQQFRTGRGNQGRAQAELEREQFCKALINDLNQRRSVDLPSWMIEPKIIQETGWYLRQDLIWHKPNPMPESVRDRCTKAHEYIFLLSKSARYYFDAKAIAEDATNRPPGNTKPTKGGRAYADGAAEHRTAANLSAIGAKEKRNKRSVWTVVPKPYKEAHFATYPPELIEPCVLAGCPAGGTVLDPFGGSGTTAGVALKYGRKAIICELNPKYADLVPNRVRSIVGDIYDVIY